MPNLLARLSWLLAALVLAAMLLSACATSPSGRSPLPASVPS